MSARLPDDKTLTDLGFTANNIDKLLKYQSSLKKGQLMVDSIKRILRKNDRQQFVNRFEWGNLPDDLTGEFIERVLYYRYSGIFFYISELDTFNFLPYVGSGLDEKGRYTEVSPLSFCGNSIKQENKKAFFIPGLKLKPIYNLLNYDSLSFTILNNNDNATTIEVDPIKDGCVILNSYCKDLGNRSIPEQELMEPVLEMMSEALPLARTNLLANSGAKGMKVTSQDDYSNVLAANNSLEKAALNGERLVPIIGSIDFQDLSNGGNAASDMFFMYMQTLDNFRLQSYGLKNNGLFEKNQYVNETLAGNIQANVGQILQDALTLRQEFCDMVNAIWGLGITVKPSETVTNFDINFDGEIVDNTPQQDMLQETTEEVTDE